MSGMFAHSKHVFAKDAGVLLLVLRSKCVLPTGNHIHKAANLDVYRTKDTRDLPFRSRELR